MIFFTISKTKTKKKKKKNQKKKSGAVLVAKNGKVLLCNGYGYADIAEKVRNGPNYEFRIGSITKPFVSILIMQLIEQNKIKLDGQISSFFPGIDSAKRVITIKQLLQQTSGIEDYTEDTVHVCPAFSMHPIDPS